VPTNPKINRRGWLAIWLQKRRQARQHPALPSFSAPSLVAVARGVSETTWQAVAPVAVDGWQFCLSDNAFHPEVKTFDRWVYEADSPDTEFVIVNATTATVTQEFAYCAARYRVGTTWSSWSGVVDRTILTPLLVLSSDGHGRLTWTMNFTTPYGFAIYRSDDGTTWGPSYDGTNTGATSADESGIAGYFRICQADWDGLDVLPYSNVVYSDGL